MSPFFVALHPKLTDFPRGFGKPEVVIQGDIFEASHTYRLKGLDKYVTLVEAQGRSGGRGKRYYKAYIADSVAGEVTALAATAEMPFAGNVNVKVSDSKWTDSFSHGELIRSGYDEHLEVEPVWSAPLASGFVGVDSRVSRARSDQRGAPRWDTTNISSQIRRELWLQ